MCDLHYFRPEWIVPTDRRIRADLCVYGGTSGGLMAAIAAVRCGKSAAVLHPGKFVGGLTTGGLGWTDYGRKHVIGGLARQFYQNVGRHYAKDEEFLFEPHVASQVFDDLLREHRVEVLLCQYLDRVEKQGPAIRAVTMLGGLCVEASVFIDATYEGDLLARAGVSYAVGREDNSVYGETLNGIHVFGTHQFSHPVDPYVHEGDASSGLLPGILAEDLSQRIGRGDCRVQAYNFRVCMTDDPKLILPWQQPQDYDPQLYVVAGRWFRGAKDSYNDLLPAYEPQHREVLRKFDIFPHRTPGGFHKTDTNNHGPVSSDFIGANHAWPQADYPTREKIFQAHVAYQQGLYWYMANTPEIPAKYRDAVARWGLTKDEFTQTAHWPHALYVREARRMVGVYVITEHDCRGKRPTPDAVGMGSYGMDSHNCSRFVKIDPHTGKARVLNDGDFQEHGMPPYPIPYRTLTPQPHECTNLLVPVCVSSSHVAYGSARMEPVFMVLGQSAAIAACLAIDNHSAVQDVPYAQLEPALLKAGQVLRAG